jgi:hypothetical protein
VNELALGFPNSLFTAQICDKNDVDYVAVEMGPDAFSCRVKATQRFLA